MYSFRTCFIIALLICDTDLLYCNIRMTHADKEFYYASCNLALEIKGKFIGANTWYIPLKLLEFYLVST